MIEPTWNANFSACSHNELYLNILGESEIKISILGRVGIKFCLILRLGELGNVKNNVGWISVRPVRPIQIDGDSEELSKLSLWLEPGQRTVTSIAILLVHLQLGVGVFNLSFKLKFLSYKPCWSGMDKPIFINNY